MPLRIVAAVGAAAMFIGGCAPSVPRGDQADGPGPVFLPAGPDRIRTTDGRIYVDNLNAKISLLTERLERRPSPALRRTLAQELFHRFQLVRALRDLERADQLTSEALDAGADPAAILLKARIDAAFHRFSEAFERLDEQPDSAAVRALRAEIARASGRPAASEPPPHQLPDFRSLAAEGHRLLDQGELNAAMARFHLAERAYGGADPVPLAWLHVQVGIGYLRYGRLEAARLFFEAALDRLPAYTPALDHLAETLVGLGRTERAIALYEELIETTGDPEFCGVLAPLVGARGERDAWATLEDCAENGFRRLVARHPEAYWQHAAEFYLFRDDVEEAYRLARLNWEHRQDVSSQVLMARTALARGETGLGCRVVDTLHAAGWAPPELGELNLSGCPRV